MTTKTDPLADKVFKCARCPVWIKPGNIRVKKGWLTYCETCALDDETRPEKKEPKNA